MEIPWILISILIMVIVLAVIYWKRRDLVKKEIDYKHYLRIGIVFLAFGLFFEVYLNNDYSTMTTLGVIFILAGGLRYFLDKNKKKKK